MTTIFFFGLGFVFQIISSTPNHESCDSDGFFQMHGMWHLMSAIAPTVLFFFFISEKNTMRKREERMNRAGTDLETVKAQLRNELQGDDSTTKRIEHEPYSILNRIDNMSAVIGEE